LLLLTFLGFTAGAWWKSRELSPHIREVTARNQELMEELRETGDLRARQESRIARAEELNRKFNEALAESNARRQQSEQHLTSLARLPQLLKEATPADIEYFFRRARGGPASVSLDALLAHLVSVTATHPLTPARQEPEAPSKTFIASSYQEKIFDWIREGTGDAIIHAVAGSGKTTTLVEASKLVKADASIFLAFNKSIAEELKTRLKGMTASTLHGLGLRLVKKHFNLGGRTMNGGGNVDDHKYTNLRREYLKKYKLSDEQIRLFGRELGQLLNLTRLTLTNPRDEGALLELMSHHAIQIDAEYLDLCIKAVAPILDEGIRQAPERLDFTDMVWLPNVLNITGVAAYEWIFVDEAQDLNAAQRELVLRSRANGGRILFVGDPRQAIYGFAGADSQSLRQIAAATGAQELPLSVCYRCPSSHVELAKSLVPHIEPAPGAPRGILSRPSIHQALSQMKPGDLVISRCSAPLAQVYGELRKAGIPAYIEGADLKEPLLRIVRKIRMQRGFNFSRFPDLLAAYAEEQTAALRKNHPDPEVAEIDLKDHVSTIGAVYRATKPQTADALMSAIEDMYAEHDPDKAVRCSTIHKAKGLESEYVFLVAPHLLPHPKATKDWQLQQEYNLQYVAYTRAKYFLAICQGEL
jgi:superfamily I DNA/RNA helicase